MPYGAGELEHRITDVKTFVTQQVNTVQLKSIKPNKYSALLVAGLLLAGPLAGADFRTPRTSALGGAGRANPILNDAIYLNPSFASFLPVYSWSANFKALGEGRGRAYNVSVLDGRSELFQAGLAYQIRDPFTAAHLVASRKIDSKLTVGAGAKLYFSKDKSKLQNFRDFTVSATYVPLPWLQIAAVAENLDRTPEMAALGMERELILGSRFKLAEKVFVYADPHFKLGDSLRASATAITGGAGRVMSGYEVGGEFEVFKDVYFRAGMFKNSTLSEIRSKANGVAYGMGWVGPKLSFDFAVEHILLPVDQVTHTSGATFYF